MVDTEMEAFKAMRETSARADGAHHRRANSVIIKRDSGENYVYFLVDRDGGGSIIDFIQQRRHLSFGGKPISRIKEAAVAERQTRI
jgi:hypothetical protein